MSQNTLIRKKVGLQKFRQMFLFSIVLLILVMLLYIFEPFTDFWNDFFSDFAVSFAAGLSAFLATRVFASYAPSDPPRRIWMQLALGLWLWTFGEIIWTVYNLRYGEVGVTFADLLWVCAYAFFGYAVYIQYQIVFHPEKREFLFWVAILLGAAFALTVFTAQMLVMYTGEQWSLGLLIYTFYPAADLVVGISALRIVMRFRGGALGYPWFGLFAFAISDMLYTLLEFSGIYSWSLAQGNLWSTVTDTSYLAAYLIVGLGCYAQLLLLRYGPIFTTARKDIKKIK